VWDNGDVAFNRGYSFSARENWGFADVRKGVSMDYAAAAASTSATTALPPASPSPVPTTTAPPPSRI